MLCATDALAKERNLDFYTRAKLNLSGNCPPEFISGKFVVDPFAEILTVPQPDESGLVLCKPACICRERCIRDHDAKLNGMSGENSSEITDYVWSSRSIACPMVFDLGRSKNWEGAFIPEEYVDASVLSIGAAGPTCFEFHGQQSIADEFLKLLLADAVHLVWVNPESIEKKLRHVDQLDSRRHDYRLVKRKLELASGALLFKMHVALDAMDTDLSRSVATVLDSHWVRIISVVVLALLDRRLTEGTFVPTSRSEHCEPASCSGHFDPS